MVVGRRSLPVGKLTFSGVVLNFGGVSYGRLKSEIQYFMEKTWFKTRRLIWYFLKILVSFNFRGVKILNTQMCFWDGKFLQGRKDVPQMTPSKKKFQKKNMGYQCGSTLKFETTIQWHQMFKISESQMPGHKLSKKLPFFLCFFQWNIYPSGGVVFFVYRTELPQTHVVLFHRSHVTWFFPTRW